MSSKISYEHQSRTAIVYVRQSTSFQIAHNLESQRRQYGLVDYARQLGFGVVDVIDEDLGPNRFRLGGATWVPASGWTDLCRSDRGRVLCRSVASGPQRA